MSNPAPTSCLIERAMSENPTTSKVPAPKEVTPQHQALASILARWSCAEPVDGEVVYTGDGEDAAAYRMLYGTWYRLSYGHGGPRLVANANERATLVSATGDTARVEAVAARMGGRWGYEHPVLLHDDADELSVFFEDADGDGIRPGALSEIERHWSELGGKATEFVIFQYNPPEGRGGLSTYDVAPYEAVELIKLLYSQGEPPSRIFYPYALNRDELTDYPLESVRRSA